jgi:hypothetical protein
MAHPERCYPTAGSLVTSPRRRAKRHTVVKPACQKQILIPALEAARRDPVEALRYG